MKKKTVALCFFLVLLTAGVSRYAWYTFTDFTDRGVDKLDNKDPVGALIDFNRAIKKNNKDPAPFLFSAIAYMRGGYLDEASGLANLAMVLAELAGDKEMISGSHMARASIASRRGNYKEAFRECFRAENANPDNRGVEAKCAKRVRERKEKCN